MIKFQGFVAECPGDTKSLDAKVAYLSGKGYEIKTVIWRHHPQNRNAAGTYVIVAQREIASVPVSVGRTAPKSFTGRRRKTLEVS